MSSRAQFYEDVYRHGLGLDYSLVVIGVLILVVAWLVVRWALR